MVSWWVGSLSIDLCFFISPRIVSKIGMYLGRVAMVMSRMWLGCQGDLQEQWQVTNT